MQETQNTKVVQDAYAAFGRGDIAGILGALSDDVVWRPVTGAAKHVPMGGERRGKAAVKEFFAQVGANINFARFEPREFVAQGDKVVTLGHYTGKTTKGGFDSDFVMVFTLKNGTIVQFQEFLDVAQLNAAF